jgi:hypothetical protein
VDVVKHVRIWIKAIGPDDGSGLLIDAHTLKVFWIAKRIT